MAVKINELKPAPGSCKKVKRIGRGSGSGHGKTSCRGHKGQKSRAGYSRKLGFEGGQMPLVRRIPKRGFKNVNRKTYFVINLEELNIFENGTEVNPDVLREKGLAKKKTDLIKVLGNGALTKNLIVKVHAFSNSALEKIKACGGKTQVISKI
ncbi:MAG: 50S ribosomal protein L15 [Candidatus Firestonebacteria bacterium]|nr:50S ribosomal protein L15 [Candidatus Firestonebacteria bacterium]